MNRAPLGARQPEPSGRSGELHPLSLALPGPARGSLTDLAPGPSPLPWGGRIRSLPLGPGLRQTMLNFRVRDLDAMLAQLPAEGADVAEETQEMVGVGLFGWSPILRAIGSSCGSPPDCVLT